ncbi:MAG: hypothetical protein KGH99_07395, partial [Thaumarchaeota archaeon]|nr:hypothetical protein [Nitrososphaerota archaeon]
FASTRSDNKQTRDTVVNVSGLAMGAGIRLMEDDIDDMPDWFNFEKKSSVPQPILQENYLLPSQISQNNPTLISIHKSKRVCLRPKKSFFLWNSPRVIN